MSDGKLVSIVMPTYNQAAYLEAAVASVLAQTYGTTELIIVNDGSTDETPGILKRLTDARVTIVTLSRNSKLPRALNVGFVLAKGEYLTWTSSDNEMLPACIEVLARSLDSQPEVGMVYASHHNVGTLNFLTVKEPFQHDRLLHDNIIGPCFMYRREVIDTVGLYDPSCFGAEDYDMWLRAAARFRLVALPDVLYVYRHHSANISTRYPTEVETSRRRAQQRALAASLGR